MENSTSKEETRVKAPNLSLDRLIPEQRDSFSGVKIAELTANDRNALESGGKTHRTYSLKDHPMANGELYSGNARLFLLKDQNQNTKLEVLTEWKKDRPQILTLDNGSKALPDGKILDVTKDAKMIEKLLNGFPIIYDHKKFVFENGKPALDLDGKRKREEHFTKIVAQYDPFLKRVIAKDFKNAAINVKLEEGERLITPQGKEVDPYKGYQLRSGSALVNQDKQDPAKFFQTNYSPITNQILTKVVDAKTAEKIKDLYPEPQHQAKKTETKETHLQEKSKLEEPNQVESTITKKTKKKETIEKVQKEDASTAKQESISIKPPKAASKIKM